MMIFLIKAQNLLFYLPAKVVVAKKNSKALAYFWQAKIISCGFLDLTMWHKVKHSQYVAARVHSLWV